jgi:Flp pilus assembly protein CpaB
MAAISPKGMRGFTIPTPNIAGGDVGFILPGNKVDVLLTVEPFWHAPVPWAVLRCSM